MLAPSWVASSAASLTALPAVSEPSVPTTMELIMRRGMLPASGASQLRGGDDHAGHDEQHDGDLRVEEQLRHASSVDGSDGGQVLDPLRRDGGDRQAEAGGLVRQVQAQP